MPPISIRALLTAFSIEVLVDLLVGHLVLGVFAGPLLEPGMSAEEVTKVAKVVFDTTTYLQWMFVFGMGTTVAGAYLAARLAKRIPYYHGLAMGIIGMVFGLFFWHEETGWLDYLGLILSIPFSLLGAHLARRRMVELDIL